MEKKHVCKHCFKRFPCGKSLGGHIRTHTGEERTSNASAAIADNDAAAFNFNLKLDGAGRRKKRDLWSESEATIYGLRENPKKSMRFVHSDSNANAAAVAVATNFEQHEVEEKFCKECGKGFPSLKALCGHMACHSDKDKKINTTKVVIDTNTNTSSQSDTTENCVPRRSKRFKSLTLSDHKHNHNHNYPSSLAYASSPEQEAAKIGAMCLIQLSKDPNFIYIDHFASQNNLLLLDTQSKSKSSSFDTNVESRKRGNYDSLDDNGKRENSWEHERMASESCDDDDDDSAAYETDENSSETDSYDSKAVMMNGKKKKSSKVKKKLNLKLKSKKSSKEHECPICYRIFKSGQALGGHKRSHFVGGNEENTLVIKQAAVPVPVPVPCLIDLNLPAPVDE